jgi:thiol-disulfide isomerase/thioredoxin
MNRRQWGLSATAGILALGAGATWRLHREGPQGVPAQPLLGLWDQQVQRPDGTPFSLGSLRGQPLLINFWATWCPPCLREMPVINRFHQEVSVRGWRVLGLALDKPEAVAEYLKRHPVGYLIGIAGLDGVSWSRELGNAGGALPFSVSFDAQGQLRHSHLGEISQAELRRWAS